MLFQKSRIVLLLVIAACLAGAAPVRAGDALAEARRLYNAGQYDAAATAAREAVKVPATANSAGVVLGRTVLEVYRQSAQPADLAEARAALGGVDPRALDARERVELTIGLGEALFLEDRFGAAADVFDAVLDSSVLVGPGAHERVLDWWATAIDRLARTRPQPDRGPLYARVSERMTTEAAHDPGSTPAGYWLAAAARASGDLDRAWAAAQAGWVLAGLARDRGATLRADLDRLVVHGIIPDRAAKIPGKDQAQTVAGMTGEWDAFKANWSR